jgi:hypothetical protein
MAIRVATWLTRMGKIVALGSVVVFFSDLSGIQVVASAIVGARPSTWLMRC